MTSWQVRFDKRAEKDLAALGTVDRDRIRKFIETRILATENPRLHGRRLSGSLAELWRYRVGDIRVLVEIKDSILVVVVITVGNRREVYR